MPVKPGQNEKQQDFHSRCMKQMTDEGKPQDQANAICFDMWKRREALDEALPQPRMTVGPAVIDPGPPREKQYEFLSRCVKEVRAKNSSIEDDEAMAMC